MRTSGEGGGVGKHGSPAYTTTAEITTKLQKRYYSELSENRTVWKSNDQGIKVMFIQMGGKHEDMMRQNGLVPHTCVVDKNWEGYLRSEGSPPHTRPSSPGFQ